MDGWHGLYLKLSAEAEVIGGRFVVALLITVLGFALARVLAQAAASAVQKRPNGNTLAPLARSTVRVAVIATTLTTALQQLGVPVATVIAGAGVAGIAIGFGAQALVKDLISGFFHIVEGVLAVGDVVQLGDVSGVVEEVGLRVTQVRTFNGQLWYIPNGTIDRVGNSSRGWGRAIIEVRVAQENDLRRVLGLLAKLGETYQAEKRDLVLEPPSAEGALTLDPTQTTARLVLKVKAGEQWGVERELRLRIKESFEAHGIEIPYPRQMVFHRAVETKKAS